jgi:hypothetical protein
MPCWLIEDAVALPYTVRLIHPCRPGSPSSSAGDSPLASRSSPVRLALVIAALAMLFAPPVLAATFDVSGPPPGAELVLDGEVIGVVPLQAPIELPHGRLFIIQIRKPGFITHEEQVFLQDPDTHLSVSVELLGLSRKTATITSALLAGTGQFYQRRNKTGWVHLGAQLTAWGSAIYGGLVFGEKRDDYNLLDQKYKEALDPAEIEILLEERDTAWNEMKDAESWRNWSLAAVAAIAAWSSFDAWRGHNRFYAAVYSPADSPDGMAMARVGLQWNFGGGAR